MAGHMHFNATDHAWDMKQRSNLSKLHGVNITNTTNRVPVRNPVPVPLLS